MRSTLRAISTPYICFTICKALRISAGLVKTSTGGTPAGRVLISSSRPLPPPVLPPADAPATSDERGAIFLRADRLEGTGDKRIEAAGKVELRTRRETVLADWLEYDYTNDTIWGKGDVTLRRGLDWVARLAPYDLATIFTLEDQALVVRAARGRP